MGTGFRAPALAENYFPGGNPDLRPEHSKGWDCGVDQILLGGRFVIDATYFRNDFIDRSSTTKWSRMSGDWKTWAGLFPAAWN